MPHPISRRALIRAAATMTAAAAAGVALPAAPAAAAVPLPADVTQFMTPTIDPAGLFLLARGADGTILFSRGTPSTNSYGGFFSIGGQIVGDPTAAIAPQGAQVFARAVGDVAVTNLVVSYAFSTGFQTIPGLQVTSEIAAVRIPLRGSLPPMIRIFARGPEGAVYTNLLTEGVPQAQWTNLGGFITSEITVAELPSSDITVPIRIVVRGGDNRLYSMVYNNTTGTVVDWAPVGTLTTTSNPTLANAGTQFTPRGNEVFVRGPEGAVWTWNFDAPGWVSLGGRIIGDIAVSIPSDNGLHLHVRGTNNAVHLNRRPPGGRFGGFLNLGGVLTGNIAAAGGGVINGRTVVDQFITRTRENGISSRQMLNFVGGFTSFFNIPGPPVA